MSMRWLILILALFLAAMMSVVMVRAEITGLHYELSQLDRRTEMLRREIIDMELELERLRNPALIRARLDEWRRDARMGEK